ncbi:unnamed protein product [Triticum aestivum]|uniref:Uncharacterized protein n=1 Tax=Triticum aestivum TaxID=4565 RepID=A0A7H4LEL3_WHEAT|nr:unnamed protein product [Triticum aestivum]
MRQLWTPSHRYTSCMKQLKPELALRKNKHVPLARNSNVGAAAPTPAPRASHPAPTTAPTAGTGGAGRGAAAVGRGAATAGIGGAGRGAFYAPRQYAPSTSIAPPPSGGRHSEWRAYFYASGNH